MTPEMISFLTCELVHASVIPTVPRFPPIVHEWVAKYRGRCAFTGQERDRALLRVFMYAYIHSRLLGGTPVDRRNSYLLQVAVDAHLVTIACCSSLAEAYKRNLLPSLVHVPCEDRMPPLGFHLVCIMDEADITDTQSITHPLWKAVFKQVRDARRLWNKIERLLYYTWTQPQVKWISTIIRASVLGNFRHARVRMDEPFCIEKREDVLFMTKDDMVSFVSHYCNSRRIKTILFDYLVAELNRAPEIAEFIATRINLVKFKQMVRVLADVVLRGQYYSRDPDVCPQESLMPTAKDLRTCQWDPDSHMGFFSDFVAICESVIRERIQHVDITYELSIIDHFSPEVLDFLKIDVDVTGLERGVHSIRTWVKHAKISNYDALVVMYMFAVAWVRINSIRVAPLPKHVYDTHKQAAASIPPFIVCSRCCYLIQRPKDIDLVIEKPLKAKQSETHIRQETGEVRCSYCFQMPIYIDSVGQLLYAPVQRFGPVFPMAVCVQCHYIVVLTGGTDVPLCQGCRSDYYGLTPASCYFDSCRHSVMFTHTVRMTHSRRVGVFGSCAEHELPVFDSPMPIPKSRLDSLRTRRQKIWVPRCK